MRHRLGRRWVECIAVVEKERQTITQGMRLVFHWRDQPIGRRHTAAEEFVVGDEVGVEDGTIRLVRTKIELRLDGC